MATWAASINHPWFTSPSVKRKLPESPAPITNSRTTLPPRISDASPPQKRRRHDALEANFSTLSLNPADSLHGAEVSTATPCSATMKHRVPPICSLNSIEEPSVPEIKMKKSSWYEPEPDRIVVTDLDSSSDEETEINDPDEPSVSIPPALLKQLWSHSRDQSAVPSPPSSQALVLFRPLPIAGIPSLEDTVNRQRLDGPAMDIVNEDESMDVGLW